MDDSSKLRINKYLVNIINSLVDIKDDSKEYRSILLDKLKTTYIKDERRVNAINIKDLYSDYFMDDEYVFVLGFNQDYLPKTMKDVFYITDDLKDELDLYKTPYKNNRLKNVVINILANIENLYLSYKKSSPFATYYKSPIITDLSLNVIKRDDDSFSKSNIYNKIRLVELLDLYNLYKEERPNLKKLYTNYDIPYKTYSNEFTKIDNDKYLENIPYPLKLSYTSMNTYNECRFKYYIKYVLKLDEFTDTFQAFIGSMYHKILSLYRYENFDFEKEYNKYLEKRDLSLKEKLLLVRIKKELKELLNSIKSQDLITGYNDSYFEKKFDIALDKKVSTIFTGTIDKIMYYKKIDDMYFSIIDYKTGNIDTSIEAMKYGLHMQLPIYLYLINYSKVFKSPIFTGIYYQNILFNYPNFDYKKDLEKLKNDRIKLQGYTTDDAFILERFDPTYEDSSYIKSMKYDDKKGFSRYTKLIGNDTLYDLINYTRHFIDKTADDIIDGDFSINPKIYDKKNISCEFCKFKDLCYMSDKDLVYLEKQKDLSFLGGDNNA
jgi:ATP-dependent helicase/DNAse subunit B